MEKILSLVNTGVKEGAKLVTGGKRCGNTGYFVEPTVFSYVEDHHTIAREEVRRTNTYLLVAPLVFLSIFNVLK